MSGSALYYINEGALAGDCWGGKDIHPAIASLSTCSAEAAFFKCGPHRKMDGEKIYYLTLPTIVYYAGSGKET